MSRAFTTLASPIGQLRLFASDSGLTSILWEGSNAGCLSSIDCRTDDGHPLLRQTRNELEEYFAGGRRVFSIPLDPRGSTFQKRVWLALGEIPFGETRSYLDIARQLGRPGSVRAVGAANGRNPLAIVVPCHRVIGSNGKLTGFAGGLAAKRYLLALESTGSSNSQTGLFD